MKNVKKPLIIMAMAAFALTGCTDSDEGIIPEEIPFVPPTAEAFAGLRAVAMENRLQTTSFNAEDGVVFTSEKGVLLTISGGCIMDTNGDPVTGEVQLDYMEIFEKGNMMVTNKPTMGVTPEGDKALLVSGGEFYVMVTQDGEELQSYCAIQMTVPPDLTGGIDEDMTFWTGAIDDDGNLAWNQKERNDDEGGVFIDHNQYFVISNQFGWTNVDRFFSDARPKTTLQVEVPEGFDAQNCAVYLSYDGEENALAQLDTYDENTGRFSEHYGQIPVGLEMHIIFVTEENDEWRYAIQGVTVAAGDIYSFDLEETATASEEEVIQIIAQLP
ncbi:hypothetical protein SAMN02927921_03919 [Sinomicrobium oceani]|uniref:DUF4367 domain-containing protein n=1 Tax=Sinomicrobium oceani TaxID=1150368 RepID=A0A1K1RRK4_9FLAO|nr:hypothetical protein [Sinomicrobium oceani]SFW74713.1 hypothetical protein SAMN02927921_03919 [Sinomicrobium oceani]